MDDDEEDYQALFFTECSEGLQELQEHLDLLVEGSGDAETLNAAFRTVHSIKGGASAFGFDNLISFAHAFETVMDRGRSDELELTDDVCQVFLRASDCMEILVEQARDGGEVPAEKIEKVLTELRALAGIEAPQEASIKAVEEKVEELEDLEEDESGSREVRFLFRPDPTLFQSGHDPLRMINAAKKVGLFKVEIVGEVPPTSELQLDECTVQWRLFFDTEAPTQTLVDFFLVYEAAAVASGGRGQGP